MLDAGVLVDSDDELLLDVLSLADEPFDDSDDDELEDLFACERLSVL